MRIVGHRQEPRISFGASGALLAEGARFNDEIHRLPTGERTGMRKGVFRFRTHEEANRHDLDCVVDLMVQIALGRLRRRSGVRPPDDAAGPRDAPGGRTTPAFAAAIYETSRTV